MEVTEEELKKRYETLSNEELADLYRNGTLTASATRVLKQVIDERGVSIEKLLALADEPDSRVQQGVNQKKQHIGNNVAGPNWLGGIKEMLKTPKKLIVLLMTLLMIPAVGILIALGIISNINSAFAQAGQVDVVSMCEQTQFLEELGEPGLADSIAWCAQISHVVMLADASVIAAAIGLLIPISCWLAVRYAGHNRSRLAWIFPPLIRISIALIILLVLLHGAILTYGIYIGEAYMSGSVHYFIVGAIALGALVGGIKLISNAISIGGRLSLVAAGKRITPDEAPTTFKFVEEIVQDLGAKPPTNIIVGIDPTFYVTSGTIILVGKEKPLVGETLYLSSTLARLMTKEELRAVLGHEFGHFRGEDTMYSMKFAPVYAGIGKSLEALESSEEEGFLMQLARFPAFVLLIYLWEQFSTSEAAISRLRELEADKAGVEAASARDLTSALMKCAVFSERWDDVFNTFAERLGDGKRTANLGHVFVDSVKYDLPHEKLDEIMTSVLDHKISHPTDSHPTMRDRLSNLQVPADDNLAEQLRIPSESASSLIDGCDEIEEEVTRELADSMAEPGTIIFQDEESRESRLITMVYRLVALILCTDGQAAKAQEVRLAEEAGKEFYKNFDSVDFRVWLESCDESASTLEFARSMSNELSDDEKLRIHEYLESITIARATNTASVEKLIECIAESVGYQRAEGD